MATGVSSGSVNSEVPGQTHGGVSWFRPVKNGSGTDYWRSR